MSVFEPHRVKISALFFIILILYQYRSIFKSKYLTLTRRQVKREIDLEHFSEKNLVICTYQYDCIYLTFWCKNMGSNSRSSFYFRSNFDTGKLYSMCFFECEQNLKCPVESFIFWEEFSRIVYFLFARKKDILYAIILSFIISNYVP